MWGYDFIFERTEDGRTLETLLPVWGATDCLRSDNGSEFVARQVKKWILDHEIGNHYIDLGSLGKIHLLAVEFEIKALYFDFTAAGGFEAFPSIRY